MSDHQSRSFVLDRGGLRAALAERYGHHIKPGRLGACRGEQLESALDIARETDTLARSEATDVYAFPTEGGGGVIVTVTGRADESIVLATPWVDVTYPQDDDADIEEIFDTLEHLLERAEPLVAQLRTLQNERTRNAAGLDEVPWAIARCLSDRGHDLAKVTALLAAHQDALWATVLGPAIDAVEARLHSDAAH